MKAMLEKLLNARLAKLAKLQAEVDQIRATLETLK